MNQVTEWMTLGLFSGYFRGTFGGLSGGFLGSILPNIDYTNLFFFGGKSYERGILNTIFSYNGEDWSFANQNMTRRRSDFVISQITNGIKCTDF